LLPKSSKLVHCLCRTSRFVMYSTEGKFFDILQNLCQFLRITEWTNLDDSNDSIIFYFASSFLYQFFLELTIRRSKKITYATGELAKKYFILGSNFKNGRKLTKIVLSKKKALINYLYATFWASKSPVWGPQTQLKKLTILT
jgi:hypothetical protein